MSRPLLRSALALWLCATAHPAAALPLISEVFYDAVGSDDGRSFVELHGSPGTALGGLALEGVNGSNGGVTHTLVLAGSIPADGLFVVADDRGDGTSLVPDADWILDFDFQNGPDSVRLVSGGTVLDALGYGAFGAGEVFAGEGQAAPDAPAGASLARRFANLDSGDNAADFVVLETPTPGVAPVLSVPEPASAVLLLGGLGILRARRLAA